MSKEKHSKKSAKTKAVLIIIFSIILIGSIGYLTYNFYQQWSQKQDTDSVASDIENAVETAKDKNGEEAAKKVMLEKLAELKKENNDIIGWLKIADTNINYPVVQTDNNDYYINHNFKKKSNELGSIFLDKDCSIEKPTANFLIYGHRSEGGQMFETLTKYKKESFYKEHKTFEFSTLNEVSTYQIIAVFQSQVYYKDQDVFKYYFFKDAKNKTEFDNYIKNIKKLSMYNIEDTATYGDQLITLSTCDYHVEDGRFAVVAKRIDK